MAREVSGRDDMRFTLCGEDGRIHFLRGYIMSETFIYLWYDAPNKKYYLGKHKGSPDDKYTHSSTVWESCTKDNIPEGVTRRILAYGTDEEMCVLEHELLVNRKKRCWDRYYNQSLGDPRYVDTSGENNPMWKGGITYDRKAYRATPEYKERRKLYDEKYLKTDKYQQTYGNVEYRSQYERKRYLRNKAAIKAYHSTPEYKAYKKEYDQRPERQEYNRKRNQTPERKAYMREWKRKDYAKKKAERQGAGTLDAFLK